MSWGALGLSWGRVGLPGGVPRGSRRAPGRPFWEVIWRAGSGAQKNPSNGIKTIGPRIFGTSKVIKTIGPYSVKTHPPNPNNDIEVVGFL